jgi:aminoglycoside 2''-phosphotransferase
MTQHLYYSIINERLPNLFFHQVEHAGGQFHDVLIVNREWVFRFPRYREGVQLLIAEANLLEALQGKLPLEIPQPLVKSFERPVPGLAFTGHKMIPGEAVTPAEVLAHLDGHERLAGQLAGFLRALHQVDLASVPLHLPGSSGKRGSITRLVQDSRQSWEAMYSKVREKLIDFMRPDAQKIVTDHYEAYLDDPKLQDFIPCLRHGDFGGDNILWDRTLGLATGVIDFSFCAVGDAAYDLASISTLGETFYTRLAAEYEPDPAQREALLARALFYRGTFALIEALDGLRDGDEQAYQRGMQPYV